MAQQGSIALDHNTVTLMVVPGAPSDQASAVVHVHVETNAPQGYQLTLARTPGEPATGTAPTIVARPSRGPVAAQAVPEQAVSARQTTLVDSSVPDRGTGSDVAVELSVPDDFMLDPGTYTVNLQFQFTPRYGGVSGVVGGS